MERPHRASPHPCARGGTTPAPRANTSARRLEPPSRTGGRRGPGTHGETPCTGDRQHTPPPPQQPLHTRTRRAARGAAARPSRAPSGRHVDAPRAHTQRERAHGMQLQSPVHAGTRHIPRCVLRLTFSPSSTSMGEGMSLGAGGGEWIHKFKLMNPLPLISIPEIHSRPGFCTSRGSWYTVGPFCTKVDCTF